MDGKKAKQEQEMYVIKHNELIRARYDMTVQQQKIVNYAVSKIKYGDKPGNKWYEISIEDLCNACGLVIDDTGYYYKSIKEDIRKITKRLWVQLPDKREITFSWFADAEIVPLSGTVYIKFHDRLSDLLFLLNNGNYTQYQFFEIQPFQSKYTIRIYENLVRMINKTKYDAYREYEARFTISELREMLMIEGYSKWAELKRNVIDRAVNEINTYSDEYHISYDTYKKGKNIESINFIVTKPSPKQIMEAHQAVRERMSMQRKPTEKTMKKREKVKELAERTKELESKILSPAFEPNEESTRKLLEITKEYAELIPEKKITFEGRGSK